MKQATKQRQAQPTPSTPPAQSVTNESPKVNRFTPRTISIDRAVEICARLGVSFSGDERINLLSELVTGLSISQDELAKNPMMTMTWRIITTPSACFAR